MATTTSTSSDASAATSKLSLLHILATGGAGDDADTDAGTDSTRSPSTSALISMRTASGKRRAMTAEEKRKARNCVVDGCTNYIVHRQRCFRHGGGRACSVEGCNTSAKQRGLCWRHGGSILCTVEGCGRGVKSKGLCWTHRRDLSLQPRTEPHSGSSSAAVATGSPSRTLPRRVLPSSPLSPTTSGRDCRHCLFDACWERPVTATGFCRKHAQAISQQGYVFEL